MLVAFAMWSDQFAHYLEGLLGVDPDYVLAVLRIIGINIVLSGDNAVVIALACRTLPRGQRLIGIILGAGAAVVLRIIFTLVVQQLFDLPWLKLVGGLILFWIAVKLLLGGEAEEGDVKSGANVWEALKIVAIADIIMSLDNVLAIAGAAGGNMQLIILGLAISIPLVVFGSTVLMWLLNHLPILVWAGSALLGWVAAELIVTEKVLQPAIEQLAISMAPSFSAFLDAIRYQGMVDLIGGLPLLGPTLQQLLSSPAVTPRSIARFVELFGAAIVVVVGWAIIKASRLREATKQPAE
jgi:YjbE family integral membrane protein